MLDAAWVDALYEALCSCALCQQHFDSRAHALPRLLSCGHSLCSCCVQRSHQCPLCNAAILPPVPVDAASLALAEQLSEQRLWLRRQEDAVSGAVCCDLCDPSESDTAVVAHCLTCRLLLCDVHDKAHARGRVTKQHAREPVADYAAHVDAATAAFAERSRCPRHHLLLDQLCTRCQVPVCDECGVVSEHATHTRTSLQGARDAAAAALRRAARDTAQCTAHHAEKLSAVRDHTAIVEEMAHDTDAQIDAYFDDLVRRLADRRAWLHADVAASRQTRLNTLAALGDAVAARVGALRRATEAFVGVLDHGDTAFVVLAARAAALLTRRAHAEAHAVIAELSAVRDFGVRLPMGDDVDLVGWVGAVGARDAHTRRHHHGGGSGGGGGHAQTSANAARKEPRRRQRPTERTDAAAASREDVARQSASEDAAVPQGSPSVPILPSRPTPARAAAVSQCAAIARANSPCAAAVVAAEANGNLHRSHSGTLPI